MKNKELIRHLQSLNPDLPVLVRIEDPCGGPDYWELTTADIAITDVDENERSVDVITIGDKRNAWS